MVGKDLGTYLARISAPVGGLERRRPGRTALAATCRQPARPNAMVGSTSAVETWLAAVFLQALLCALAAAVPAPAQFPPPTQGRSGSDRHASGHAMRRGGVTIYRGDELTYEVVDGIAVRGGDMVLGTAGPAIAGFDSRRPKTPVQGAGPSSRNISPAQSAHLWPGGVIPCVMDEGFTEAATRAMQVAIDEWNSRTVITLVERTTEPDSVLFVPEPIQPFPTSLQRAAGKSRREAANLAAPTRRLQRGGLRSTKSSMPWA